MRDYYKLLMLTESTSPVSALIFTKNIPSTIAPKPFCASTVPRTVTLLPYRMTCFISNLAVEGAFSRADTASLAAT